MTTALLAGGMAVFGLLLIYDYISLGIRVGFSLRLVAAPLLGALLCAVYGWLLQANILPMWANATLLAVAALFLAGFAAYLAGTVRCVRACPRHDWTYVVVLGAALRQGCNPSPLLRSRLEVGRLWWRLRFPVEGGRARALTRQAAEGAFSAAAQAGDYARAAASVDAAAAEGGVSAGADADPTQRRFLVVCGGQGSDEAIPEAAAMRTYLLGRGVPDERILVEDASRTTWENLRNAKKLIVQCEGAEEPRGACLVVTNEFHAVRTWLWARRLGLPLAGVVGKPTRLYYLVGSLPRDYLSLLKGYGAFVALIFAAIATACAVLV